MIFDFIKSWFLSKEQKRLLKEENKKKEKEREETLKKHFEEYGMKGK